jgi:hypothetical protein
MGSVLDTVAVSCDAEGTPYKELGWCINSCLLHIFTVHARAHYFASSIVSRPRDAAYPEYSPASEISLGGLNGGWSPFRALVGGTVLRHRFVGLSSRRPPCLRPQAIYPAIFCSCFFSGCNVHIRYGKICAFTPLCPHTPTAMSRGSEALLRHQRPPWWGASIMNRHDCIFPGEGHHIAPAWSSSSLVPEVGNPEIMKLFIMSQSLSPCLTGYTWFGQASLSSPLK